MTRLSTISACASLLIVLASSGPAYAYLHAGANRFLQRDPHPYLETMNLHQYVRGNPLNRVDPFGLDSKNLQHRVDIIENALDSEQFEVAADNAESLYNLLSSDIAVWGAFAQGSGDVQLAADLMRHWLEGSGSTVIIKSPTWDQILKEEQVSVGIFEHFDKRLKAGRGPSFTNEKLSATPTVNTPAFYALGTFDMSFSGKCVRRSGMNIELNGKWEFKDRYDWHPGLIVTVNGVVIRDDYALLVEQQSNARPFDVRGDWSGTLVVSKSGNVSAPGIGGSR
jgi:hypothetical protein